ncbi:MAG: hypothetical protein A3I63_11055 [Betaproteobacteria bacterium RIFCSPLOWO2_02_FULL_66_14]|nr:MAG: hypothetical protein A3I63_11055 [Betaproteobacteria bacterium RIFCSPLOWO2_02_FULL_66_14]
MERSFLEDLPVVLSASRIPQSLAATPGAVTVLDREFIQATGYRDLPSLLKLIPGFHVVRERGGLSHVTYHGLGNAFPNRMQVLIDGRSVYSPYFLGGVDWFAVPVTIDEIERVEVLRGSNSTNYGSNAALGVVNIVTHVAGDRPGATGGFSVGNNSLADLELDGEWRRGDFGLRLNAEVRYDDGLGAMVDAARKGVVTIRGDHRLNLRDELSFSAGVNDSRRGLGFAGDPGNSNGLRAFRGENAFAHLRWRRALSADEEIQLGYYHNTEHATEAVTAYLPPFFPTVPIDFNRTSDRDNLDFQHLFSPTGNTRAAWGLELRRDVIRSPRLFYGANRVRQSLARVFGNLEWRLNSALTLNAGAMLERYSGRGSELAPRIFLNWQAMPGHTLRIGRSIAYRAPSMAEENANVRFYSNGYSGVLLRVSYLGTPSIRPEKIAANEIGYVGQFKTWNGVFDLRVYQEKITDLIQEIPTAAPPGVIDPRTFTFYNSGVPVLQRGFEWSYRARPGPKTQLQAGYSNLRVHAPFAGDVLEHEAPRHVTTVTWIQEWAQRWNTTLSVIRYGTYEWGSGSYHVPRYTQLDARIAYRFGPPGKPSEVALVLLDHGSRHQEFLPQTLLSKGNPIPRLAFVNLKLPF